MHGGCGPGQSHVLSTLPTGDEGQCTKTYGRLSTTLGGCMRRAPSHAAHLQPRHTHSLHTGVASSLCSTPHSPLPTTSPSTLGHTLPPRPGHSQRRPPLVLDPAWTMRGAWGPCAVLLALLVQACSAASCGSSLSNDRLKAVCATGSAAASSIGCRMLALCSDATVAPPLFSALCTTQRITQSLCADDASISSSIPECSQ